jgi:hypothetical protein
MLATDAPIVLPLAAAVAVAIEGIVRYWLQAPCTFFHYHRSQRLFILNLAKTTYF